MGHRHRTHVHRNVASRGARVLVTMLLVIGGSSATLIAPASAASSPLTFSAPALIDHPAPYYQGLDATGISCPTTSLCVEVDTSGNVVTSTNPTGGQGAWTLVNVDGSHQLRAISCPTTTLCVAVDTSGNVVTSTNPTGGAGAWVVHNVDGANALKNVSCPSASLCVATDGVGNVVTSTNPASASWTTNDADGSNSFRGISCPTTTLCVAFDNAENVVTSTTPTASGAWATATVSGVNFFSGGAISCPTTTLCVAVDTSGNAVTTTNPTGGSGAWAVANVDSNPLTGVACHSTTLCVAVDLFGNVVTSTSPSSGAAAWTTPADIDGSHTLTGVSCPSASLCVASDGSGNVLAAITPTSDTWVPAYVDVTNFTSGGTQLDAVSCPTTSLCVGVDDSGNVVVSTAPTKSTSWIVTNVDGTASFSAISCPTAALCVAVDTSGNVITSTTPTVAGSWIVDHISADSLSGVSCASVSMCMVVGVSGPYGYMYTSTTPTAGSTWRSLLIDSIPDAVSCPTVLLCVISERAGYVSIVPDPATLQNLDDVGGASVLVGLVGVTCPSPSFCAAANLDGQVATFDPSSGSLTWWTVAVVATDLYDLQGVSCASVSLCVAVGGDVFSSAQPREGPWFAAGSEDSVGAELYGVSCPSVSLCVAVDSAGNVVVGTPTPPLPVVSSVSPSSGPTFGGTVVSVTGTGFTGATQVLFGSTAGTALTVSSSTQLTVTSPKHSVGLANVHVVTPAGRSAVATGDGFTYVAPPVITGVKPTSGPHAGGTVVTVTGTGFTGATQVLFGNTAGTHLTVVSSTTVTITSPAHSAELVNIHVITPAGNSAVVAADQYTYT
jgi:hypothetical protein